MLLPKVADSLAGRIEIHYLWPLSEAEIKGKSSSFLDTLLSGSAAFSTEPVHWDMLIHTMVRGGFPEALERSNAARRRKWFEAYLMSMLQKDLKDLSRIEGLSEIPKILHMIAIRVGSRINF
jgi:predicted AAA+ superfamily ATPase